MNCASRRAVIWPTGVGTEVILKAGERERIHAVA